MDNSSNTDNKKGDVSNGCNRNGNCLVNRCNRLSTFDWLSDITLPENQSIFDIVEVAFKNGARKEFFRNEAKLPLERGMLVAVEAIGGHDIGEVTLKGNLVKLQMKKKKIPIDSDSIKKLYRIATEKDIKIWEEAKKMEKTTLAKARSLADNEKLEMKIGDAEYQGDKKKITFYYTADSRVDFRELVKIYAKEFKAKIEMRQIGLRQASGRIGGISGCGRVLCCSMWLNDFKSVSSTTARNQNLAINTSRLSGQCERLKCCLNYELDTYLDAQENFPENIVNIETKKGKAFLQKTDILKGIMYFAYPESSVLYALPVEQVKKFVAMNKQDNVPENFKDFVLLLKNQNNTSTEKIVEKAKLNQLKKNSD